MKLERLGALCGVLLAVTAFAACGSDNEDSDSAAASSSSGASTSSQGASTELKGAPIKLGSICSCSGVQASTLAGSDDVMKAWADYVNDNGGINGHPVEMITKDDGGDPAKALQAAKELVESDGVMAIVGDISNADSAFAKYLSQKDVPVVGGAAVLPPFATDPNFFASGTQIAVLQYGIASSAKEEGQGNLGLLYCAESPVCAQIDPLVTGGAQLAGMESESGKVASTQPNYTAECLRFKDAGVDALYPAVNSDTARRVIEGCAQQGYKPLPTLSFLAMATKDLTGGSLDGAVGANPNANPYDTSIPGVATFQDALAKYVPDAEIKVPMLSVWSGGQLFAAAAKKANIGPDSTSDDLKKGLYALKDETLDGISPPLNFVKDQPAFVKCFFTMRVEGGKVDSENGGEPSCLTEDQAAALAGGK